MLCFFAVVERSICSLPRAAGSCSSWTSRYHYDVITSSCKQFWFGSCNGNNNNFLTRAECQRTCQVPRRSQPIVETPSRGGSTSGRTASEAGTASGGAGSTDGHSRNMGRVFTVQGGSTSTGNQATSAATNAHRGRVYLRARRPSPDTAAQHTGPSAR